MEIRHYRWNDGKSLTVGEKTLIMGVLNYTPDSFSDGGKWNDVDTLYAIWKIWWPMVRISSISALNRPDRVLRPFQRLRKLNDWNGYFPASSRLPGSHFCRYV